MLSCLAIQGSSLCGLSFKVGQEYLEVVGNTRITDLPRRDKETAAVPLSLNKIDFVQGRIILPGGCRYWHVRTLAVLGSKNIKKCPSSCYSWASSTAPGASRSILFSDGKGTKKSRTSKEIREKVCCLAKKSLFLRHEQKIYATKY